MITRAEKNKLKRKLKWNFISGLVLFGLIVALITFILIIDQDQSPNENHFSIFVTLSMIFILILTIGMFFLFGISSEQDNKLLLYSVKLERKRNNLHVKQFWNKIIEGKYDEAKEMFNHETLIQSDSNLRYLTLGVLLGVIQQNGKLGLKWDVNPMEKMNDILSE